MADMPGHEKQATLCISENKSLPKHYLKIFLRRKPMG
jgi:hypothetical protein